MMRPKTRIKDTIISEPSGIKGFILQCHIRRMIMSSIFSLLILWINSFCSIPWVYSDTYVSGIIGEDTTWTLSGSPYFVAGDITVRHSTKGGPVATLTVEPGVEVRFAQGTGLYIGYYSYGPYYGALSARGTDVLPVIFTSPLPRGIGEASILKTRPMTI